MRSSLGAMAPARFHPLLAKVRRALAAHADPERAKGMQAYMKSEMPFHGVPAPLMRATCKTVFKEHAIDDAKAWRADVLALFRGARFREERYASIELAGDRRARAFQTFDSLPMYEEMIVEGAWWDLVDGIATHRVGTVLVNEPAKMRRTMLAWSRDANMWKRRTSIICQVPRKSDTDLELLYACIEPSLGRGEFFLRKAIGWALRQYAWTDPDEIVRWVEENRDRLSPLSIREALKNVSPPSPATSSRGAKRRKSASAPHTPSRARRS
jgi:3-methyladenine DNA glycosylase AlkD